MIPKFAGPCAQSVLDPVIVPCPMSLGCSVLFVLIKDNAFLGTSTHESVTLAGYLPAPCRSAANSRCTSHQKTTHQTLAGSSENLFGPCAGELGANLGRT